MAKPNLPLNTNFKVCARIRPLEYTSRMLEVTNESVVTIRDINNKTNMEKQSFHFNKVFDQNSRQESVFNYVVDNAINKALEGTNCCILSYGQTSAGKTHTTFGDDEKFTPNTINLYSDTQKDKKGLVPKTIEYLLKKNSEMQGVRELILTCSFVEIYLDQVRDLSRNFTDRNQVGSKRSIGAGASSTTTYENENLEIYEHANGQMLIRNVKNVVIKSMDELIELLSSGFLVREKAESKGSQIWARAHTIFTINIVQKEVENEDLPFPKSMIQFVDLAGSERIAKSITEGQHKFQEAVLIMSHLTSLYKVLSAIASNSKNIPYRDSKLTKVLYNCLTPYNNIIMFVHLHPAESNFEETLNTLQYAERSKNTDQKEKWGMGGNPSAVGGMEESNAYTGVSGQAATDKLWKKMTDEISELKTKLETLQKEQKGKLDRVQQYLGLEIDLDKVSPNPLSKEALALTNLKNTFQENQNLKVTIAQTEEQFEIMKREIDEDRREFYQKQSKMEGKNVELKEYMKKDIDKFKTDKNKDEEDLRRQIKQLTEENKKLVAHNSELLSEKSHALRNFSTNLEARAKELTQGQDMKDIGKREAENQFREELAQLKTDYNRVTESLKQQYEHWLQTRNDEIDTYAKGVKERQARKKAQISNLKGELVELHSLLQRQEKIIEKVENGGYSGGLKSFQVPTKDKCTAPTRHEFPHLFKALDEKKTENTQSLTKEREPEGTQPFDLSKIPAPPILTSKSQARFSTASLQNTGMSVGKKSIVRMDSEEPDLNANLSKMKMDDLKRYVESTRRMCLGMRQNEKKLREEADKFVQLNVSGNIRDIISERDKYKELYQEELKRNNESRLAIESQQRLLTSAAKSTSSQAKIRPGTAGWQ